ncbi:hypothetical protein [Tenacibaculum amylolyticum]|uniref:hypothetical protein n=1 Tax=Tenacibaculum amylolyticum TaxID=104269 RepID=UPI003893C033
MKKIVILVLSLIVFNSCNSNESQEVIQENMIVTKKLEIQNFKKLTPNEKLFVINKVANAPLEYGFQKYDASSKSNNNFTDIPNAADKNIYYKGDWVFIEKKNLTKKSSSNWEYDWFFDGDVNISSGLVEDSQVCGVVTDLCEDSMFYGVDLDYVNRSAIYKGQGYGHCGKYTTANYIFADNDSCEDIQRAADADPVTGIYYCPGTCDTP